MILVVFILIIPQIHVAPHRERSKSRPTLHQISRPTRFDDEGANDDGSETEGSLFEWEEEATLLSELMEEE